MKFKIGRKETQHCKNLYIHFLKPKSTDPDKYLMLLTLEFTQKRTVPKTPYDKYHQTYCHLDILSTSSICFCQAGLDY